MEEGLKALEAGAQSGRLKDIAVAQQRLERLKQKYTRAAGAFDVQISQITPQDPNPPKAEQGQTQRELDSKFHLVRLGSTFRRLLCTPHQSERIRSQGDLATLHPVDGR